MALYRTNSPIGIGSSPVSNATADLNGDGHLDLLFTNYISDNVSVLFGDGTGSFVAGTPVGVTNGPREVEVGDLDGDGDIDALVTNLAGNNVSVLLNNGLGSFSTSSVAVGSGPRGLVTGDLDGDGDLDFVSANYASNSLSVMLNNGDGTFTAQASSPVTTGGTRPVATVLADFNGDGVLDIAVTNNGSNNVGILLNNGDGSFAAATTVATGVGPRGITSGDLDGDGDVDLVVANFSAGTLSILVNDGAGAFTTSSTTLLTGSNPYAVAVGDIDGDGDLDIAVSNSGSSSISVFLNDGSGAFSAASGSPFSVGVSPGGIVMGDFDEDGDLDIASTNFGSNTTSILINTGALYSLTSATSAREGNPSGSGGELVFTVTRTATSEAEDVTYVLGGTATSGDDYTAPSGTVSFAAGQKTAEIHIAITADRQFEHDETVTLTLTDASGEGTIKALADSLSATIENDDPLNGTDDADVLKGSPDRDRINGKLGDDQISGSGGDDHIFGGSGNDRIRGGGGDDFLYGQHGADRIFGNSGNDHIFGGGGHDVMTGRSGDDVFVFKALGAGGAIQRMQGTITDFTRGEDKIDLSGIDADTGTAGDQAFTWHGSDAFVAGQAGWLMAEEIDKAGSAHDVTVIMGDTDGDGRMDFKIELSGLKSLDAGDFVL